MEGGICIRTSERDAGMIRDRTFESQRQLPRALPANWEVKMDPISGWPFFVDHLNRRTTWHDPRFFSTCRPSALADYYPYHSFLPPTWEQETSDFFRPRPPRGKPRPREPHSTFEEAQPRPPAGPPPAAEYPRLEGLSLEEVPPEHGDPNEEESSGPEVEAQLAWIRDIARQVDTLHSDVASFSGKAGSKRYLFLEESLMSQLLALDSTQTFGLQLVRSARKKVSADIQDLLEQLESLADS